MAHNAGGSLRSGIDAQKLAHVWEYKTSELFSDAERVAFDFSIAAASQPNAVTDELFDQMKQHWSETAIVEIAALVAYFGFMNRFNDTMATPLEDEPAEVAREHITQHGWQLGKHGPRGE
jgi:alkylhydroperoxidase family enzyme